MSRDDCLAGPEAASGQEEARGSEAASIGVEDADGIPCAVEEQNGVAAGGPP